MNINLKDLRKLSDLTNENGSDFDTNELEQNFLAFSAHMDKPSLLVKIPSLYSIDGDEINHIEDALVALDMPDVEIPKSIDISGGFSYTAPEDVIIFASMKQLDADHFSTLRSYLDPLIEDIYTNGASLIKNFSIHDVLSGKIDQKRGTLSLRETHLFPKKFTSGPYQLSVTLDTPRNIVKKFGKLRDLLTEFDKNPKNSVLNQKKTDEVVRRCLALRKHLGSLSRYSVPETNTFTTETESCIVRTETATLFYLYAKETKKNILVYFGEDPFMQEKPEELIILNGDEHQETLSRIVSEGIYKPSVPIMQERIKNIEMLFNKATTETGSIIEDKHREYISLRDRLKTELEYFKRVKNPKSRRIRAAKLPSSILEFVVYPDTEDPIVHELMSRLSWYENVRNYHNTRRFMQTFEKAGKEERKEMLEGIQSELVFNNLQNNDVNVWLYQEYREFCEDSEITFTLK